MNNFSAGAAQTDITPPLGTIINGEFVAFYAHTIHDPLYSKALVLRDATTTIAIVIVDICAMEKAFIDEVKKEIHSQAGIQPDHILIAATHTHFAGSVVDLLGGPCDLAYRKSLGAKIVQSVKDARAKLQPAKIGHASINISEHVVCRRYYMKPGYEAKNPVTGGLDIIKTNPAGGEAYIDKRASAVDPELSAVAIQSTDGKWISLLANYSMHYVGDCANGTVTADYFGVFARHISSMLKANEHFVAMLSNGTSGEANIWDFLQPDRYPKEEHQKKEMIGKDLAAKLSEAIKNIQWKANPVISAVFKEVTLVVRKPSAAEVGAAKKIVAQTDYRLIDPATPEAMAKIYAREQVLLNEYPDTIEFPVQALKIGDITIGALGGEFFAETGLALKQQINTGKYFTITMANGYIGYVPPAHEIEKGGYETWRCRSSHVKEDGEGIVRNTLYEIAKA
ncbi:neutral/alkaline non-lysosomal ceramidase N-terminal domain-containing protein [Agriterribacter sp.]|uniref:neutral/alkaline non-lysosomal ceramidase N-terminal domain-containing protein n=1 Tax=Agriterribacter sp. TaxID=2821509 RepID=UPI002C22D714|nr:neutral/alkaline non-lysosomal ceramidase N-terminal domain-containing protein [Agriterribacter sp.]HRP57000.1 neutral/alkaline non-lysosomal ceramidase N-terminal domain-containing protein [Agriterribacter sp.]